MNHIQALTFVEFMFLGFIAMIVYELCDFLASATIKFINKIKGKKGRDNNEEKF